jgi:hypothetical protein
MAKLGRPFVYQEGDKRPVTVSLRVPVEVYERLKHYAYEHRQSVTELLLEGLQWRLDHESDPRQHPRNDRQYYDNTVLQTNLTEGGQVAPALGTGGALGTAQQIPLAPAHPPARRSRRRPSGALSRGLGAQHAPRHPARGGLRQRHGARGTGRS